MFGYGFADFEGSVGQHHVVCEQKHYYQSGEGADDPCCPRQTPTTLCPTELAGNDNIQEEKVSSESEDQEEEQEDLVSSSRSAAAGQAAEQERIETPDPLSELFVLIEEEHGLAEPLQELVALHADGCLVSWPAPFTYATAKAVLERKVCPLPGSGR